MNTPPTITKEEFLSCLMGQIAQRLENELLNVMSRAAECEGDWFNNVRTQTNFFLYEVLQQVYEAGKLAVCESDVGEREATVIAAAVAYTKAERDFEFDEELGSAKQKRMIEAQIAMWNAVDILQETL